MAVKRHYAKQWRNELRNEMLDQLEIKGNRVADQLERILFKIVKKTLRFSSQFGTVGLRDATIDIQRDIRVHRRKGLLITMNVMVLDTDGNPHLVWHILNYGRKQFVQRKTSPLIRARNAMRTVPGTLTVERFPGYSGDTFVIPAGTVVDGIEAREWYQQIHKEYQEAIQDFPSIKALNLRVVRFKIKKPDYL